MFAAAVDSRKGFFVQQAGQSVAVRHLLHDIHGHLVLVGGDIDGGVDGRELVLRGSHLIMLGLGEHAELPKLLVEIAHESGDAGFDGAEVVIFELLSLGGTGAEQRPARVNQVAAGEEGLGVDEEIFLLGTHGGAHALRLSSEEAEQPDRLFAHRFHGAEQGGLLVEGKPVVAAERGGDAEGAVLDEGVGSGVPCRVAARFEGRAQTAARERAGVGFALDELLAAELHDHAAVVGRGDEGVVFFGGQSRHGLEPMSEMGRALLHRPILHRARDDIRGLEGEGTVVVAAVFELPIGLLGQAAAHDGVAEHHAAENFGHYHKKLLSARAVNIILNE